MGIDWMRRAERIGAWAVERETRRIVARLDETGIAVSTHEQGLVLEGRRPREFLEWIGLLR
jgi:hypothetical protein